jgi:hypothetical protein
MKLAIYLHLITPSTLQNFQSLTETRALRSEIKIIHKMDQKYFVLSIWFNFLILDFRIRQGTENKKAEAKIIKANRLYSFISQMNQMIVRVTDQESLFREASTIAVEVGI